MATMILHHVCGNLKNQQQSSVQLQSVLCGNAGVYECSAVTLEVVDRQQMQESDHIADESLRHMHAQGTFGAPQHLNVPS